MGFGGGGSGAAVVQTLEQLAAPIVLGAPATDLTFTPAAALLFTEYEEFWLYARGVMSAGGGDINFTVNGLGGAAYSTQTRRLVNAVNTYVFSNSLAFYKVGFSGQSVQLPGGFNVWVKCRPAANDDMVVESFSRRDNAAVEEPASGFITQTIASITELQLSANGGGNFTTGTLIPYGLRRDVPI